MSFNALERACRRIVDDRVVTILSRRARGRARPAMRRVLFLRPDRVGDMIASTGLLRAITDAHPTLRLDVLASRENAPIARHLPGVFSVIVLDRQRPWRWGETLAAMRAERYDAVIDCMPSASSTTTLLLMLASGAPRRIGVAGRGLDEALTDPVPARRGARHVVDQLSALGAAFGIDAERTDFAPSLHVTDDEHARALATWDAGCSGADSRPLRLLVNVSARASVPQWPSDYFAATIRAVRRAVSDTATLDAVVIGAPIAVDRARSIAADAGARVGATPSIRDAIALVATADVVVTPDASISNAAVACRTPVVMLTQPRKGAIWGVYASAPGAVIESDDATLASIPPFRVTRAVTSLLAQRSLQVADVEQVDDIAASGDSEGAVLSLSDLAPGPPIDLGGDIGLA